MTSIERLHETLGGALSLRVPDARLEGLLEQASKSQPRYADFPLETPTPKFGCRGGVKT